MKQPTVLICLWFLAISCFSQSKNHEDYFLDEGEKPSFTSAMKKSRFHLSVRPGLSFNSVILRSDFINRTLRNTGLGRREGIRLGIEAEYVFPFNKDKWSILFEPSFKYFETLLSTPRIALPIRSAGLDLLGFSTSWGIRYFFVKKREWGMFISGNSVLDIAFNSRIGFDNDLQLLLKPNFKLLSVHLGYLLRNKFSAEVRYWPEAYELKNHPSYEMIFSTFSIIVGYRLF